MRAFRVFFALVLLEALALFTFTGLSQVPWEVRIEATNFISQANGPVYPGSTQAELRVEVRFFVNATRPVGQISVLPQGITPSYGYGLSVGAKDAYGMDALVVYEGQVVHFVYRLNVDKSVKPGTYYVNFQLTFLDSSGQSKTYYMWVPLTISPYPEAELYIFDVYFTPAGYIGTYRASLRVTVENRGESSVYSSTAMLECPAELVCETTVASFANLPSGGRVTIDFSPIDIPEGTEPDIYNFSITLHSSMMTKDGVIYYTTTTHFFSIEIGHPPERFKQIVVLQGTWGEISPQPAFPDTMYAQLSIDFFNRGPYNLISLESWIDSEHLTPVSVYSVSSTPIGAGQATSLGFYVSVETERLFSDKIDVYVHMRYSLDLGNRAYLVIRDSVMLKVDIERYPKGDMLGVSIYSTEWQNSYSVYPDTEDAVLVLRLSNNLPYTLYGLNVTLVLPDGFSFDGEAVSTYCLGSPLQRYGTAQALFTIDVHHVQPGTYAALAIIDYVADVGGPGKRMQDHQVVNLTVKSLSSSVEFISGRWEGGSPDIGVYGANYVIFLRNIDVDIVSYPVLFIELPEGLAFAYDNSTRGAVLPRGTQQLMPETAFLPLEDISQYIQYVQQLQQGQARVQYERGDTISFTLPLNILTDRPENFTAKGILSFLDQWGTYREVEIDIPIAILGSTKLVVVDVEGSLDIRSRYSNATLVIYNIGGSYVYNVYVNITYPRSPLGGGSAGLLIVTPSLHYLQELGPGEQARIPIILVYNPQAVERAYPGISIMSYGVVPLDVSITLRDASGTQKMFRYQIAVAVEPFIDIVVSEARALLQNGTLKVSGTIVNYGSSTAYRLSIVAIIGRESRSLFIGDLEPGSTRAFRLDYPLSGDLSPDIVMLNLTYYNAFNELMYREVPLSIVEAQPPPAPVTTEQPSILGRGLSAASAAIILFILLSGYLIYRIYRAHMRRLQVRE